MYLEEMIHSVSGLPGNVELEETLVSVYGGFSAGLPEVLVARVWSTTGYSPTPASTSAFSDFRFDFLLLPSKEVGLEWHPKCHKGYRTSAFLPASFQEKLRV